MLIGRNVLGLFITLLAFASGFSRASLRRVQSRRNGMTTLRDTSDESGVMEAGGGKAIGGIAVLGAAASA